MPHRIHSKCRPLAYHGVLSLRLDTDLLILGIAILIGFIIYSFNAALASIVNTACSRGPSCPMWGTIEFQTNVSMGIMAFVILIAISGKKSVLNLLLQSGVAFINIVFVANACTACMDDFCLKPVD